jgi:serine/threonine protein kinase/Tol biopolymer transport system component
MPLEPNTPLLHYRLLDKIGEGGMGVVWKALDTSLGREVAIKVLPGDFAADAERLARFEREARLLASLNHPHIAGIYGIHEAPGEPGQGSIHFLAMELVNGEDLSARISRGPIPVAEAVRLASEVATGLETAHENGVIHRDLKPANIRLTADGRAKVLDFGLAKAAESTGSGDISHSPTMTSAGTVAGMILGTASYMSPEQAAGQPIDRRCDIWSFGVVFFEMLSGKRMFEGETLSHTLADVLRAEIDLTRLPPDLPKNVRRLVERCLERDANRRLRDIGEARIALQDAIDNPEPDQEPEAELQTASAGDSRWPWLITALAVLLAVVAMTGIAMREDPAPEPVRRFTVTMPNSGNSRQGDGAAIAISPDGNLIVTRGGAGSDDILYMRALDQFEARPVEGTSGASLPQFSPDGRWLAFVASGEVKKVRVSGGASTTIGWYTAAVAGYHWAPDDWIYYPGQGQLWRSPANGGEPEQLSESESAQTMGYREPFAIPERGVVLCSTTSGRGGDEKRLLVLDLATKEMKDLQMHGAGPRYLPTGHLLFAQSDSVVVAGFDLETLEFTSSPVSVLARAWVDQDHVQLGIASNGTVAYMPRRPGETQALVYVDHAGKVEPVVQAGLPFSSLNDPRISPDGDRVAVTVESGIWMLDLLTQTTTLLTENGFYPVWSPDSSEILFTTTRNKTFDIYRVPVDLSQPEQLVLDVDNNMRTMDWTAQNVVVLREELAKKGMDLRHWSDLDDESKIVNLLDGDDDELAPIVSPDGNWVAYVSDYSGPDEIYVTSFPTAGARTKISNSGGNSPTWSPDGKTLYYLDGLQMMAVTLETEPRFRVLSREKLFEGEYVQYRWSRQYDLHPDGKRFIMVKNPPRGDIEVVTNWFDVLRNLED